MRHNELLMEKIRESLRATLPITAIVLVLAVTIAPLTPGTLVLFLFGALLLVFGMGLFTLGVDMSMIPMGDGIGVAISRARRLGPAAGCARRFIQMNRKGESIHGKRTQPVS